MGSEKVEFHLRNTKYVKNILPFCLIVDTPATRYDTWAGGYD